MERAQFNTILQDELLNNLDKIIGQGGRCIVTDQNIFIFPAKDFEDLNGIQYIPWSAYYAPIGKFLSTNSKVGQTIRYNVRYATFIQTLTNLCSWKRKNEKDVFDGTIEYSTNDQEQFSSISQHLGIIQNADIQKIQVEIKEELLSKDKFEIEALAALDSEQDEIMRLPVNTKIILDGLPGSGKTTTAIKTMAKHCFYDEDGKWLTYPKKWLYVVPNEILKDYIQSAFIKEQIPAPKKSILPWEEISNHLLNIFKITGPEQKFSIKTDLNINADKAKEEYNNISNEFNLQQWENNIVNIYNLKSELNKFENDYKNFAHIINKEKITNLTSFPNTNYVNKKNVNNIIKKIDECSEIDFYAKTLSSDKEIFNLINKIKPYVKRYYNLDYKTICFSWNFAAQTQDTRYRLQDFINFIDTLCVWYFICKVIKTQNEQVDLDILIKAGNRLFQDLPELLPQLTDILLSNNGNNINIHQGLFFEYNIQDKIESNLQRDIMNGIEKQPDTLLRLRPLLDRLLGIELNAIKLKDIDYTIKQNTDIFNELKNWGNKLIDEKVINTRNTRTKLPNYLKQEAEILNYSKDSITELDIVKLIKIKVLSTIFHNEYTTQNIENIQQFTPYKSLYGKVDKIIKDKMNNNILPRHISDALLLNLLNAVEIINKYSPIPKKFEEIINSLNEYKFHKIIVDEVTDFSPIQIEILSKLSPNGLLMCGDLMQRTTVVGTDNWNYIKESNTYYKELLIGYRQNPHLLEIANRLYNKVNNTRKTFISYFPKSEYDKPAYAGQISFEAQINIISKKIKEIYNIQPNNIPSIAVFVPNDEMRTKYANALRESIQYLTIRECTNGQTGSENEIRVVNYDSIKGLEFEITFLTGIENTPSVLRDKFLYLALTRAKRNLYIMGDLPELLSNSQNDFNVLK